MVEKIIVYQIEERFNINGKAYREYASYYLEDYDNENILNKNLL
jgi:hypothetical protein